MSYSYNVIFFTLISLFESYLKIIRFLIMQYSQVFCVPSFNGSKILLISLIAYTFNLRPYVTVKQSNPFTCLNRRRGFQQVEAPSFQESRHMEVVRLSALRTRRLYPQINIPGTHFCQKLSKPQGHSAAARIISMKNSDDGNRTRYLPTCAVPQPPSTPYVTLTYHI
jgi:hypothetical protein